MQCVNSRNGVARIVANDRRAATHQKKADARRCLVQGNLVQICRHAQAAQLNQIPTHESRLTLERPNDK
eukprot:3969100-Pleurochrysis_carterae.AAC.1